MSNKVAELYDMINQTTPSNSADFEATEKLSARQRFDIIFDKGTFVEIGSFIGEGDENSIDSYGAVITGYGSVNGNLVFAFSQDYSRLYGALTPSQTMKIVNLINLAIEKQAPLIGVFDSAGAKLDCGITALDNMGYAIEALEQARKTIFTIAIISGPCGGITATLASMFSFKIISKKSGSLYISPSTSLIDKDLISPDASAKNGLVDLVFENDNESCKGAVKLIKYFASDFNINDNPNRLFDTSIFENDKFNMLDVINQVVDSSTFLQLQSERSPKVITGLGFVNGVLTAIVATNPSVGDGKICPCGIEKITDFIEKITIENHCIPLLTLVDCAGLKYGDKPESKSYPLKIAKLSSAYLKYNSVNPHSSITITVGESYGTAYVILGSKSLGTTINYALDRAKIGIINPTTAVEFLSEVKDESKANEYAQIWAKENASPISSARQGYIDDIIPANELRQRIAASIMMFKA